MQRLPRTVCLLTLLVAAMASGLWRPAEGAEPQRPGPSGPPPALRVAPAEVSAPLRAEVVEGQAVVVRAGGRVVGRITREQVDASGVAGRHRVVEFGEVLVDAGRRQVLFSARFATGGSANGPVGVLQADPEGDHLAALYTAEGREVRGLTLSLGGRLLALVLAWHVSGCERLGWPVLLDLGRPRDPEVWLPADLLLQEDRGELPYFHEVRWRDDGVLTVVHRPVTPSPECHQLPARELAFDVEARWFKNPLPAAFDLRLRAGRVLQAFLEAVADGDLAAAHGHLSPAAQRKMPMEVFRERFARRPPAFTNGARGDDNRVTFRFLAHHQEAYYFYTLIPMGGTWRISAIRELPTSAPWPD